MESVATLVGNFFQGITKISQKAALISLLIFIVWLIDRQLNWSKYYNIQNTIAIAKSVSDSVYNIKKFGLLDSVIRKKISWTKQANNKKSAISQTNTDITNQTAQGEINTDTIYYSKTKLVEDTVNSLKFRRNLYSLLNTQIKYSYTEKQICWYSIPHLLSASIWFILTALLMPVAIVIKFTNEKRSSGTIVKSIILIEAILIPMALAYAFFLSFLPIFYHEVVNYFMNFTVSTYSLPIITSFLGSVFAMNSDEPENEANQDGKDEMEDTKKDEKQETEGDSKDKLGKTDKKSHDKGDGSK